MRRRTYGAPRRSKRKISFWRKRYFWITILFIFVATGLVYIFFFSSIFQFDSVEVKGADSVSPEAVLSTVPARGNLFLISSDQIQKSILNKFPEIGRVQAQKNFLTHKLAIDIVERQKFVVWCRAEGKHPILPCIILDSQGVAFREEKEIPPDVPVIVFSQASLPAFGSIAVDPKILLFVVELKKTLESWNIFQAASTKIQSFSLEPGLVAAHTTEGWNVYFTQEEDHSWQETKLREVLEKQFSETKKRAKLKYIDVRFGNQAYVK